MQGRYWARIHLKMSFSNEYLMSYISSIIRKKKYGGGRILSHNAPGIIVKNYFFNKPLCRIKLPINGINFYSSFTKRRPYIATVTEKTGNRANYLYCTCISKYFTDQRAKKRPKKGSHFSHEIFWESNSIFMNSLYTITPNNKNQLTLVPRWWQQTDK